MAKLPKSTKEQLLEVTFNKSLEFNIEKIVWEGVEIPWTVRQLDVDKDPYTGYTVRMTFEFGGELTVYPLYLSVVDNTPPAPTCDCCGQELPNG